MNDVWTHFLEIKVMWHKFSTCVLSYFVKESCQKKESVRAKEFFNYFIEFLKYFCRVHIIGNCKVHNYCITTISS